VTIYTLDVAEYQPNPSLLCSFLPKQGYAGLMCRCVIGSYVDPLYAAYLDAARANKLLFAAYWFPHTAVPLATSLDLLAAHIGDKTVPVGLIDWENDGSSVPSISLVDAALAGIRGRGLTCNTIYTYGGYWSSQGGPTLYPPFAHLIGADYGGNPAGYGSVVYPGDGSPRWSGYGGLAVKTGLQFGSNIVIDGYPNRVDCNAWTMSRAGLVDAGIFKDFAVTPPPPPPPPPPPNPAGLIAPSIEVAATYTNAGFSGGKRAVLQWAPVPKADWYLVVGSGTPMFVEATPLAVTAFVPPGGWHVRAYCIGSTGPASNSVTV
jgi:hypothetical protein